MMNDPSYLSWWEPVHLMYLSITDTLSPKQQQKIVATLHKLAELREKSGDELGAHWCHALAGDIYEETQRPTGTDPAGSNNKKPRPDFLRLVK
jgi:hypothetical protein